MGCGCKKKKNQSTSTTNVGTPNSQGAIESRKAVVQEQANYQSRVKDALKQLMEIKKNKQRIKR